MVLSKVIETILKHELPYEWVIGKDIEVEEDMEFIFVRAVSQHAIDNIGHGEFLKFTKE